MVLDSGIACPILCPTLMTDTPMTAHLKQQGGRLASVENVAQLIVKAINQGKPVVYAPAKWAVIMMVIRHLPVLIFNKIDI